MSKIIKITSAKDNLIDKLLEDKNRLYLRVKKLEKEIEILKNNLQYARKKCKLYEKQQREELHEFFERSSDTTGSKGSK